MATLFTAFHLKVKAIASLTDSGSTALWMSRHNCGCPIFALTPKVATQRKMALYRNVRSLFLEQSTDRDEVLRAAEDVLLAARRRSSSGDLIVLTIGEPMGKSGGTNTMKIVRVGETARLTVAALGRRERSARLRPSGVERRTLQMRNAGRHKSLIANVRAIARD